MPMEGCAFVCGILSACCAIIFGYALKTGDWGGVIVAVVFALIVVIIAAFALAYRYCR